MMTQTQPACSFPHANDWVRWLPILFGLLVICIVSFSHLLQTTWQTEENGHGPIILIVVCWLFWQKRNVVMSMHISPNKIAGWISLCLSLLLFVVGSSQAIDTMEVASLIPMLIGILLLMRGWQAVYAMWFPLVFMLFLIPLPGLLVEIITGTLKQHVSGVAEEILYAAGYPVARLGVMLSIGDYKLLVADACSGLNSMFSLSALGFIYLYLMKYRRWLHICLLLLAILPIAFMANVIRVMALVLITYYFGDEAGQGFAHNAAGMLLFIAALLLLMAFDGVLRLIFFRNRVKS